MKVERPRARLSEAPTRLNRRSTRPKRGAGGGDEAAGLGEQHDQRVLAQEGRLAAHVGAGDQPQPARPARAGNRWRRSARRRLAAPPRPPDGARPRPRSRRRRRTRGRHQPPSAARSASAAATSSRASASAVGGDRLGAAERRARSAPRNAPPRRRAHGAPAWPTRLACSCRSGALKRTRRPGSGDG